MTSFRAALGAIIVIGGTVYGTIGGCRCGLKSSSSCGCGCCIENRQNRINRIN